LTFRATGGRVAFDVMILFPWNAEAQLFNGERVFVIGLGAEAANAAVLEGDG
jgi:hypothetical protein